jgi:hypothetical protein
MASVFALEYRCASSDGWTDVVQNEFACTVVVGLQVQVVSVRATAMDTTTTRIYELRLLSNIVDMQMLLLTGSISAYTFEPAVFVPATANYSVQLPVGMRSIQLMRQWELIALELSTAWCKMRRLVLGCRSSLVPCPPMVSP